MLDGMFYHKDRWSSKKRPELHLGAFKRCLALSGPAEARARTRHTHTHTFDHTKPEGNFFLMSDGKHDKVLSHSPGLHSCYYCLLQAWAGTQLKPRSLQRWSTG